MRPGLLGAVPGGALLSRLLGLFLSAERHDEFLGDLIEEAGRGAPAERTWWIWQQILRSLPSLVVLRVRHALAPARPAAVLVGPRLVYRSWSLSVAVSVGAHLAVLAVVLTWVLGRVDEIEPARIPVVFSTLLPTPPAVEPAPPPLAPAPVEPRRTRAPRHLSRALELPPVEPPTRSVEPPAIVVRTQGCAPRCGLGDAPRVFLPPTVAEKRCLSCPPPRLTPVYVRLGLEQVVLVKTCVDVHGTVSSVDVLRGLGPLADAGVRETVRAWSFSPHLLDGHPVPFCYRTRFVFAMN